MKSGFHLFFRRVPFGGYYFLNSYQRFRSRIGGDFVIQGSYNTGNIGDLAIGFSLKNQFKKFGFNSLVFGSGSFRGKTACFNRFKYHVIGGGGIIRDYPNNKLENVLYPVGSAKKDSFVLSVGFNGIRTDKGKKIIKKLDLCSFISVRNKKSKENLERFISKDVDVAACPAFLLKLDGKIDEKQAKSCIGINLHDFYGDSLGWGDYAYFPEKIDIKVKQKLYLSYVENTLKRDLKKLSKDFKLFFIPFTFEDIVFAKKIFEKGFPIEILSLQTPKKTLQTVFMMDRMICMRYHSIVFSILAEKPMFIISYQNKTFELVKDIRDAGYIDFLNPELCSVDFNIKKNRVVIVKKEMINSALKNIDAVKKVVCR